MNPMTSIGSLLAVPIFTVLGLLLWALGLYR